jgi:hypothetical protein
LQSKPNQTGVKRLLTSVWILGLVIAIPVLVLLPPVFQKYRVTLVKTEQNQNIILKTYFYDLNKDGILEEIKSLAIHNQLAFQVYFPSKILKEQMNFRYGYSANAGQIYFGDQDNNGFAEVYAFTMNSDSLFLNWFEPYPKLSNVQLSRFISKIGRYDPGEFDFGIYDFTLIDLNNDGKKEIVFSIEAGHSLTPRRIFVLQPKNGALLSTDDHGINAYDLIFDDLDNDGKLEIITSSSVSANLKNRFGIDTIDNRPLLQVFNGSMDYFFPPLRFPEGLVNEIRTFVSGENTKSLFVFHFFKGSPDGIPVKIYDVNTNGNKTDSLFIPYDGNGFFPSVIQESPYTFLLGIDKKIYEIGSNLQLLRVHKVRKSFSGMQKVSLSGTGSGEFILNGLNNVSLYIFDYDFSNKVTIDLPEQIKALRTETDLGPGYLMVQSGNNEYYYHYVKNRYFWLKYPFYFLIYCLSAGFIRLIQKMAEKRVQERYALQEQVRELQLKSVNNQIDPHFMFNLFNTIASLMKKGEQDKALQAFIRFTKLVRSNLENGERLTRTLEDELDIVNNWLELNRLRYGEKLAYAIVISEGVNEMTLVPKMFLQIHMENALKHGLAAKKGDWKVKVMVNQVADYLCASIEDNGIGRKKAEELKLFSSKKGHKMLQAIYDRLNETNRLKITQRIMDLTSEMDEPLGTRIEIDIPLNLKEN